MLYIYILYRYIIYIYILYRYIDIYVHIYVFWLYIRHDSSMYFPSISRCVMSIQLNPTH